MYTWSGSAWFTNIALLRRRLSGSFRVNRKATRDGGDDGDHAETTHGCGKQHTATTSKRRQVITVQWQYAATLMAGGLKTTEVQASGLRGAQQAAR